jgi:hypothetical protein
VAITSKARDASAVVGAITLGLVAPRIWRSPTAFLARMSGSSIAAPDAALGVTDFLNAAYYARRPELRDIEDLRIAFAILTTRWHRRGHRRLRATDIVAFNRAFGRDRLEDVDSSRGQLDREQLLAGGAELLGPWFPDAYFDDRRRGWAIAFETPEALAAYRPEERLRRSRLAGPAPPERSPREQAWHTYNAVPVTSAERVVAALSHPPGWPDFASELGRFTPVRSGGLEGQTFEIEIVTSPAPRAPVFLRGYVTATILLTRDDTERLDEYARELNHMMVRAGRCEPPPFPVGCTPIFALELTTHEGHFMGRGVNRLLLYEHEGRDYLRAAGTWDEMPLSLEAVYRAVGREAQHAFWGNNRAEESMVRQIAVRTAGS